jgi:hypothetical protein
MTNINETCTGAAPTSVMKTEKEYFDECFAITTNRELIWRARNANHFNGSIDVRDSFNVRNAGRAITKIEAFNDITGLVELDGRNVPIKYVIDTILEL